MKNNLIYVCSPYSGEVALNVSLARKYCRAVMEQGYMPVAPHLYFPQFLDDNLPKERELGLQICERLIRRCSAVWVFGSRISSGMSREITCAEQNGIPVVFVSDFEKLSAAVSGSKKVKN